MPVLDEKPKWIVKSKAFQGVFIMLLTVIFGSSGWLDVGALSDFLDGFLEDGILTVGAIWSILGTKVRESKVVFWPSSDG